MHVLTDRNVGGAGRWLLNFLRYYNREQFLVKVVLPSDSELITLIEDSDVEIIRCDDLKDMSFDKGAIKPLQEIFKREAPDVVHTHASLSARMAALAAKVPKSINTKHCMEGAAGSTAKKMLRRGMNHRYSNCIIAVSNAVRKSMIAGGTNPKQIVTIANGVTPLKKLTADEKKAVLAPYGAEDKKAVGIVARLEEVKDHKTFLLAAQRVVAVREDIQFYIVGDGSLKEELQKLSEELNIAKNVTFTGFLAEVEEIESALDLSVITSTSEALCLSIIESMSAGIPAVGTDTGGISEVICHGVNGYLVPVGDDEALAERILNMFEDEEKYRSMCQQAEETVKEKYLAEKMTARIERLYLEDKI